MPAFFVGLAILNAVFAPQPGVHFARILSPDEAETYKFNLLAEKLKLGFVDTIQLSVKSIGHDTTPPRIVLESQEHRAVSGDAGPKPDTLSTTVGRHNMPSGLSMAGSNYIFLLTSLAAFTPDKDVDIGDSYVIEYANEKEAIKIHGRANITAIDEKTQTISAHIAATISMDNQPLGKVSFSSQYNLKNGALRRSNGTFGIPKLTYVIVIDPG